MSFSFVFTVCGWGLVIPLALRLISWLLPWRAPSTADQRRP
ncbi:hypothetical protein [Streptomyces sp. NBRC 110611]|nr:hypothetical protein [Streptomyces sp. NBRC 110611]